MIELPLYCPLCQERQNKLVLLAKEKAPFYINNKYVGEFESVVCKDKLRIPSVHFAALTVTGYKEATKTALNMGLIGSLDE